MKKHSINQAVSNAIKKGEIRRKEIRQYWDELLKKFLNPFNIAHRIYRTEFIDNKWKN